MLPQTFSLQNVTPLYFQHHNNQKLNQLNRLFSFEADVIDVRITLETVLNRQRPFGFHAYAAYTCVAFTCDQKKDKNKTNRVLEQSFFNILSQLGVSKVSPEESIGIIPTKNKKSPIRKTKYITPTEEEEENDIMKVVVKNRRMAHSTGCVYSINDFSHDVLHELQRLTSLYPADNLEHLSSFKVLKFYYMSFLSHSRQNNEKKFNTTTQFPLGIHFLTIYTEIFIIWYKPLCLGKIAAYINSSNVTIRRELSRLTLQQIPSDLLTLGQISEIRKQKSNRLTKWNSKKGSIQQITVLKICMTGRS